MSPRPPTFRASFDPAEMIVDSFAGGGGASTGIAGALGRSPDIAINHSPEAIAMHTANHPETRHYREDIWAVDPREACAGRSVGLAWFSPDCTHFSKAKGGQPRSKEVRGLAHVVVDWARKVRPRVIVLENVEEFQTWGPLDESGQPIKSRAGEDFRAWLSALVECGYVVEFRLLVAADYGTPTTRKRLFLVARCDGQPIVWPDATHGKGRAEPWHTAAEVIDWSLPCPSIFGRKRSLAEATLRRIAAGLRRFVIESPRPFIVPLTHHSKTARVHDIHDPFRTITAANRGELALVSPFIAPVTHTASGDRVHPIDAPLRTVTTAKGGEFVLVSPTLIQTGYGERDGQAPRVPGLHKPLGTVMATGQKHGLGAAVEHGEAVYHEIARAAGFDHEPPPNERVCVAAVVLMRAGVERLRADRDALREIIAGSTTAPTDAEIEVHEKAGGRWRCLVSADKYMSSDEMRGVATKVRRETLIGCGLDARWWPLKNGAPCAWPVVTP